MTTEAKYPEVYVHVDLDGPDGNAFAVMGRCAKTARRAGVPKEEIERFYKEATSSSSYDNLLDTCKKWFDCHWTR